MENLGFEKEHNFRSGLGLCVCLVLLFMTFLAVQNVLYVVINYIIDQFLQFVII